MLQCLWWQEVINLCPPLPSVPSLSRDPVTLCHTTLSPVMADDNHSFPYPGPVVKGHPFSFAYPLWLNTHNCLRVFTSVTDGDVDWFMRRKIRQAVLYVTSNVTGWWRGQGSDVRGQDGVKCRAGNLWGNCPQFTQCSHFLSSNPSPRGATEALYLLQQISNIGQGFVASVRRVHVRNTYVIHE